MLKSELLALSPVALAVSMLPLLHAGSTGQGLQSEALGEGVLLLASIAASLFISRRLSNQRLARANALLNLARQAAEGEIPAAQAFSTSTVDESDDLALAVNALVASLAVSRRENSAAQDSFRRIFETLPVPASLYSGDLGCLVQVNDAFCRYYAIQRERLIGSTLADQGLGLVDEARPLFRGPVDTVGHVYDLEASVRAPGGQIRQVVTSAERILLHGRSHILSVQVDVTERVQAKRALQTRKEQLDGILSSALDAIITVDCQRRIVVFNEAASQMFEVPVREALGSYPEALLPPEARDAFVAAFELERDTAGSLKARRLSGQLYGYAQGRRFPIDVAVSGAGRGDNRTFTAVIRDLTAEAMVEAAMLQSAQAVAANNAKTQFLSRMSHELRTPLNAMMGFAQLLRESASRQLTTSQVRQLDLIYAAGNQLTALIEDVLDLSRVEAGSIHVTQVELDLAVAAREVLELSQAQSIALGVQLLPLIVEVDSVRVRADPVRVQQVLTNLVSNAIKYNRGNGQVSVQLEVEGAQAVMSVVDTGEGLTADKLQYAFQPFNRLGREFSDIPGTGIGLALSKQLVERMGGTIALASRPEEGTIVTVRLPLAQAPEGLLAAQLQAAKGVPPASGDEAAVTAVREPVGRVLYVEDVELNAAVIQALLAPWKQVELTVAGTGEDGLRLARERKPDVILLDMHLPGISGMEVLERLKVDPELCKVPVISVSADAMPVDVDNALAAGAVAYWTKPIDFGVFREGIQRWLR